VLGVVVVAVVVQPVVAVVHTLVVLVGDEPPVIELNETNIYKQNLLILFGMNHC
jgi:hypothetical protein